MREPDDIANDMDEARYRVLAMCCRIAGVALIATLAVVWTLGQAYSTMQVPV